MDTWSTIMAVTVLALLLQMSCCSAFTSNRYFGSTMSSSGWPKGSFTLMQPASGCPLSGRWQSGSVHQDTEDTLGHNQFSKNIETYLRGTFGSSTIDTHYCTHTDSYPYSGADWPSGSYCLMRYSFSCPPGFQEGFVFWDDEDTDNKNSAFGTLPDEVNASYYDYYHDRNTKIHYCCRDDGPVVQAISLPTDHPFVLVRNGLQCQKVMDTTLNEVFIHWDDEDLNNEDAVDGAHPYDDGGEHDHRLHYCHYQNGNSTMAGPVVG